MNLYKNINNIIRNFVIDLEQNGNSIFQLTKQHEDELIKILDAFFIEHRKKRFFTTEYKTVNEVLEALMIFIYRIDKPTAEYKRLAFIFSRKDLLKNIVDQTRIEHQYNKLTIDQQTILNEILDKIGTSDKSNLIVMEKLEKELLILNAIIKKAGNKEQIMYVLTIVGTVLGLAGLIATLL
ncbi:MAG: hypothetical protein AB9836_07130 [Aminipila sp.]